MTHDPTIGEEAAGEYARSQLAAAQQDPRISRPGTSPTADFLDSVQEVFRVRQTVQFGVHALATAEVTGDSAADRQASWERQALGQAEVDGDFGWINASTLIGLHGALDALVERVVPATDQLVARFAARDAIDRARRSHPEEAAQLTDQHLSVIEAAITDLMLKGRPRPKPKSSGSKRWENELVSAGLARPNDDPVPADLDRVLTEACALRNVLVHQGGRVDQRAADASPTLGFAVDEFVRLSTHRTHELSAAIVAYGHDVVRRLLARFGVEHGVDLDNWRSYRPFW